MKESVSIQKNMSLEELLSIARRCFPAYKSGTSKKIEGTYVYINRNSLFRVYLRVIQHKNGEYTLNICDGVTLLGSLLVYSIYGRSIMKPFFQEVKTAFVKELS